LSIADYQIADGSAGKSVGRQTALSNRQSAIGNRQWLCWQGLSCRVPADWNVVKIEGDRRAGLLLLADLDSAKLGIRWATAKSKAPAAEVVRQALRQEVGQLALEDAKELSPANSSFAFQMLYEDPDPPGRDVWIGLSDESHRLVQVSYQCKRRDLVLRNEIVDEMEDQPIDAAQKWSALDLSCVVPAGFELKSHSLSAGDLRLNFIATGRRMLNVRQVGPATLALARQSIEKWLLSHIADSNRQYRSSASFELAIDSLNGVAMKLTRRRRALLYRSLPAELFACCVEDRSRNRLVLITSGDRGSAEKVAASVGWASRGGGAA
jgi:hypothetical protein